MLFLPVINNIYIRPNHCTLQSVGRMYRPLKSQQQHSKQFAKWCLFCGILLSIVFVYITYRYLLASATDSSEPGMPLTWKKGDFKPVPDGVQAGTANIQVTEQEITLSLGDKSSVTVNYKEAKPASSPKLHVLFLHGASFSSQTWKDIGTLQLVAAMGHRAVAIDLPGYGKSHRSQFRDEASFMDGFIAATKLDRPVLICASMSGGFALPFLLRPGATGDCTSRVRGFVPIAPVGTSSFSKSDYHQCKVPTMIVYGENDRGAPVDTLSQLENHEVFKMKNAGHACYMNDTPEWHRLLYNFLAALESA